MRTKHLVSRQQHSGRTERHEKVAHDCTHGFGFRVPEGNKMREMTEHICPKMSSIHHGEQDKDSGITQGLQFICPSHTLGVYMVSALHATVDSG